MRTNRLGLILLLSIVSASLLLVHCGRQAAEPEAAEAEKVKLEFKYNKGEKFAVNISPKGKFNIQAEEKKKKEKINVDMAFDINLNVETETKDVTPEGNGVLGLKFSNLTGSVDLDVPKIPEDYKNIKFSVDPAKIKLETGTGKVLFDSTQTEPGKMNPAMFILPMLSQEFTMTVDKTGKTLDFELPPSLMMFAQQVQPDKDLKAGLKYAEGKYPEEEIAVGSSFIKKVKIPISETEVEEYEMKFLVEKTEVVDGLKCALVSTSFSWNMASFIGKAMEQQQAPMPVKFDMEKTKFILNVEDKTYHALDEGRVIKVDGKIGFDMAFATTEEAGVAATGKGDITYTTTSKKKSE